MLGWLSSIPIGAVPVLGAVYAAAAALVLLLLLPFGVRARRRARWYAVLGAALLLGGAAGWSLVTALDQQDVFGVQLSTVVHLAGAGVVGALAVVAVNLVGTRWWRRAVALAAVPVVLVAGGLMVNEDFAYFPTLGDVVGDTGVAALALGAVHTSDAALRSWRPPADMPAHGAVGTVTIPATVSHFAARQAWVWLPPAALVKDPPRLPVVVGLSGQPGQPSDLFLAGHLDQALDAIAHTHHGIAPILVVPDQLGSPSANPMCVDSPLGDVATYLRVDVRQWILTHEPVSRARQDWTIAGFSEGGTCAIQLGSELPGQFGGIIDVSGELAPSDGSRSETIASGFHGSARAYELASPLHVLATRRYPSTWAAFAVGGTDARYGPITTRMSAAAAAAGMHVLRHVVAGSGHDWHTASQGLAWGLQQLVPRWGLPR